MKKPPPHSHIFRPHPHPRIAKLSTSTITAITANSPRCRKQKQKQKQKPKSRSHQPRDLSLALQLAQDNENLNKQLRSACDEIRNLEEARTMEFERAEEYASAVWDLREELADRIRVYNTQLQEKTLEVLMERDHLREELEAERVRGSRKLVAERNESERRREGFKGVIEGLEAQLQVQKEVTKGVREEVGRERNGRMDNLIMLDAAMGDLECAKVEVMSAREDLAELIRLDVEEGERGKLGLPPAYGGLDEVDVQPPWEVHCKDVGRLDGGACEKGMSLLESVAEDNFGRQLRRALAMAAKLRQSSTPSIRDGAGTTLFKAASEGVANACVSLVTGMDKVVQMEASPQTSTSRKRRLSASTNYPPSPTSKQPATKKTYNSKQRELPNIHPIIVEPKPQPASEVKPRDMVSNHTLAHRAIQQTFSLIWQLLSAFDLRPLAINLTDPKVHLQLSSSWRLIDDTLLQAISLAAKLPLQRLDEIGRCKGCEMKGCAGNCVRLSRLQGYITQMDHLLRGLKCLVRDGGGDRGRRVAFLEDAYSGCEDMVAIERRCAAAGNGRGEVRHVEFVDLTMGMEDSDDDDDTAIDEYEENEITRMRIPGDPAAIAVGRAPSRNDPQPPYDDAMARMRDFMGSRAEGDGTNSELRRGRRAGTPGTLAEVAGGADGEALPPLTHFGFDIPTLPTLGNAGVTRILESPTSPMTTPVAQNFPFGLFVHENEDDEDDFNPELAVLPRALGALDVADAMQTSLTTTPSRAIQSHPRVLESPTSPVESEGSNWLPDREDDDDDYEPIEEVVVVMEQVAEVQDEPTRDPRSSTVVGRNFVMDALRRGEEERERSERRRVYGEGSEFGRGIRVRGAAGMAAAVGDNGGRGSGVRREGLRPRDPRLRRTF